MSSLEIEVYVNTAKKFSIFFGVATFAFVLVLLAQPVIGWSGLSTAISVPLVFGIGAFAGTIFKIVFLKNYIKKWGFVWEDEKG